MKINNLRNSTIQAYADCPHKFFLNYIVGFDSVPNQKAEIGTATHLVSELLAKAKKTGHYLLSDKYTNPDYLIEVVWNNKLVKNDYGFIYTEDQKEFFKEQVYNILNSSCNPLELTIIDTEKQFEIEIRRPEFKYDYKDPITGDECKGYMKLRGTIDLITQESKETLAIQDYKTGKRTDWITGKLKELEDFQKDLQLRIYDVAAKALYPKYKHRLFTIFFTQESSPFTVSFSKSEYNETLNTLAQEFQKINNDNEIKRILDDPLRKNEYFKCLHVCNYGRVRHVYMDSDNNIIHQDFKYDKYNNYPEILEMDDRVYFRQTFHKDTLCTEYKKILDKNGVHKGSQILHNISIQGKKMEVSRRNDYTSSKIARAVIE